MPVGNIVGQAEHAFSKDATKAEHKDALDKDAFLTLLVAQLGNQDPLNPMEDKEFTTQLAQFSSLEQLTQINAGIGTLNDAGQRQEMLSAVGFIGTQVMADGSSLSKIGDTTSSAYYSLDSAAAHVYVNIFDKSGNVIRTIKTAGMAPGNYEFNWDGYDWTGADVKDGVYGISIAAEGEDGEPILVDTQVSGQVVGVITEDGEQHLRLADGRTVRFVDVKQVVKAQPTVEEPKPGDGDGKDGTNGSEGTEGSTDETDGTAGEEQPDSGSDGQDSETEG